MNNKLPWNYPHSLPEIKDQDEKRLNLETSNRLSRPEISGNDWGDRDDPDGHAETRL